MLHIASMILPLFQRPRLLDWPVFEPGSPAPQTGAILTELSGRHYLV